MNLQFEAEVLIIAGLVVFTAYLTIAWMLLRASESARVELAEVGKELINRPDLIKHQKQFLTKLLKGVFANKFIVGAIVFVVISPNKNFQSNSGEVNNFFADKQVRQFFSLHSKATMAANPIWTMIFLMLSSCRQFVLKLQILFLKNESEKNSEYSVETNTSLKMETLRDKFSLYNYKKFMNG